MSTLSLVRFLLVAISCGVCLPVVGGARACASKQPTTNLASCGGAENRAPINKGQASGGVSPYYDITAHELGVIKKCKKYKQGPQAEGDKVNLHYHGRFTSWEFKPSPKNKKYKKWYIAAKQMLDKNNKNLERAVDA